MKKFYMKFKELNPKNTELKLIVIIAIIIFLISNVFRKFEFSIDYIIVFTAFITAAMCHEVAHGYAAYLFGDDTAKREGRLSFNPIKHIDIKGLLLPLLLLLSGTKFFSQFNKRQTSS